MAIDEKYIPLLKQIFSSELDHLEKQLVKTELAEKTVKTTFETAKASIADSVIARNDDIISQWITKLSTSIDFKDEDFIKIRTEVLEEQRKIEQAKIDSYQAIIDDLLTKTPLEDAIIDRLNEEHIELKENEIAKSSYDNQLEDAIHRQAIHQSRIENIDSLLKDGSVFIFGV